MCVKNLNLTKKNTLNNYVKREKQLILCILNYIFKFIIKLIANKYN